MTRISLLTLALAWLAGSAQSQDLSIPNISDSMRATAKRAAHAPEESPSLALDAAVFKAKKAMVMIQAGDNIGTGHFFDARGFILTPADVVEGIGPGGAVTVYNSLGQELMAQVYRVDTERNLAEIRTLSGKNFPVLKGSGNPKAAVEDRVLILGCPLDSGSQVRFGAVTSVDQALLKIYSTSAQLEARSKTNTFPVSRRARRTSSETTDLLKPSPSVSPEICRADGASIGSVILDINGEILGMTLTASPYGPQSEILAAQPAPQLQAFLEKVAPAPVAVPSQCPEINVLDIEREPESHGIEGAPVWVNHWDAVVGDRAFDRYRSMELAVEPEQRGLLTVTGMDSFWNVVFSWRSTLAEDAIRDENCYLRGVVAIYVAGRDQGRLYNKPGSPLAGPDDLEHPYDLPTFIKEGRERSSPADAEFRRRLIELRWYEPNDGPINPATGRRFGRFHRWTNRRLLRQMELPMGYKPGSSHEIEDKNFHPLPLPAWINRLY